MAFPAAAMAATNPSGFETAPQQSSGPSGVFGSLEFRTNATAGLGEWRRVQKKIAGEASLYAACDAGAAACPAHLREWRGRLKALRGASGFAKLDGVNSYVNRRLRFTDDRKAFGRADYWASPVESLKGRGDCEDYALAKYASLLALGFPEQDLRIVIAKDAVTRQGHAVLSARIGGALYILDNLIARPYAHTSVSRYSPVYSVNRGGRWINIAVRKLKPARYAGAAAKAKPAANSAPSLAAILRPTLISSAGDDIAAAALVMHPALEV